MASVTNIKDLVSQGYSYEDLVEFGADPAYLEEHFNMQPTPYFGQTYGGGYATQEAAMAAPLSYTQRLGQIQSILDKPNVSQATKDEMMRYANGERDDYPKTYGPNYSLKQTYGGGNESKFGGGFVGNALSKANSVADQVIRKIDTKEGLAMVAAIAASVLGAPYLAPALFGTEAAAGIAATSGLLTAGGGGLAGTIGAGAIAGAAGGTIGNVIRGGPVFDNILQNAALGGATAGIGSYLKPAVSGVVGDVLNETAGGYSLGEAIKAGASSSDLASLGFSQTAINSANIASGGIGNALSGGMRTAAGGGNLGDVLSSIGQGGVTGAVGGASNALTSELGTQLGDATGFSKDTVNNIMNPVTGAITSATGAALTGNSIADAALSGAEGGLVKTGVDVTSDLARTGLGETGLGDKTINAIMPVVNSTTNAALTGNNIGDAALSGVVASAKQNKDDIIGAAGDVLNNIGLDTSGMSNPFPKINLGGIIPRINGSGIIPRISSGGGDTRSSVLSKRNQVSTIPAPAAPVNYRANVLAKRK